MSACEIKKADELHMEQKTQLPSHLFVYTNAKAGMDKVNKDVVNKLVYDMSKDSAYYENSVRMDGKIDCRIESMLTKLKKTSDEEHRQNEKLADRWMKKIMEYKREQKHRWICVCDMDMFYAAVEIRDNPELGHVPLAVGSMSMISTTNYIARQFGVRAAMPGFVGRRLCPELVFVPSNHQKYAQVAEEIREIFYQYDPEFRALSLDEAVLDITDYCMEHLNHYMPQLDERELKNFRPNEKEDTLRQIADLVTQEMRQKIKEKTQLTASAGIASNRMLAKICSDRNKPNGQFLLSQHEPDIQQFINTLPLRKVCGIGKVMEKMLNALEITTGSDLYQKRGILVNAFSETTALWLLHVSLGIDQSSLNSSSEKENPENPNQDLQKSISIERTFSKLEEPGELFRMCEVLAYDLGKQMSRKKVMAKTISIKLKSVDFKVTTRSITINKFVHHPDEIFDIASKLLKKELPAQLRLFGLRASALVDESSHDDSHELEQITLTQFVTKRKNIEAESGQHLICDGSTNVGNFNHSIHDDRIEEKDQITLTQFTKPQENTPTTEHIDEGSVIVCPVCLKTFPRGQNASFNRHMDMCLNVPCDLTPLKKKGKKSDTKSSILNFFSRANQT